MGVGLSNGTYYTDTAEALAGIHQPLTSKQLSDEKEIRANETSGDFQSRFYATDAFKMPLQASAELAGALKSRGGTQTPGNSLESKSEGPIDAWNALTGQGDYEGKRIQLWPERVVRAAWEGLKAPGEAVQNKLPMWAINEDTGEVHTSLQAIEKANELAGLMVTGPAPVAKSMADGTLGSFIGVRSRTFDRKKLYEAQEMEAAGKSTDEIWDATGTFRGADGRWRQEVSDLNMKLKPEALEFSYESKTPGNSHVRLKKDFGSVFSTDQVKYLPDVLDHPELFKAYPELKDVRVTRVPVFSAGIAGAYNSELNTLMLGSQSSKEMLKTIVHEIQHFIQYREGFSKGANSEKFLSDEFKDIRGRFNKASSDLEQKMKGDGLSHNEVRDAIYAVRKEIEGDTHIGGMRDYRTGEINKTIRGSYKDALPSLEKATKLGYRKEIEDMVNGKLLIDKREADALTRYKSVMGEVESRNVEARLGQDPEMSALIPPYRTESIPRHEQIPSPHD